MYGYILIYTCLFDSPWWPDIMRRAQWPGWGTRREPSIEMQWIPVVWSRLKRNQIAWKKRIWLSLRSTVIIISIIVINDGFILSSRTTLRYFWPFTRYQKSSISDAAASIFSPKTTPCFLAKFGRLLLDWQLCAFLFVYQRRHLKSWRAFKHCWHWHHGVIPTTRCCYLTTGFDKERLLLWPPLKEKSQLVDQ